MKVGELYQHLHELSDEERFYQQYVVAKESPEALRAFREGLDAAEISRHKYVMPEIKDMLDLHFKNEDWVWESSPNDIYIHKHPRFMPEWDFVHEFYEVMYDYQGEFSLFVSNHEIKMKPGYVCLLPPGVHHHISIFDDSISLNTKVRKSTFNTSFSPLLEGNDILARFFLNTIYIGNYEDYILFRSGGDERLHSLFSDMYVEQYNKEKYYARIMNDILSIAFTHLMRSYADTIETATSGQGKGEKIESILGYISQHFRNVSLQELSNEFFFSEQYLSKYIKENTGSTFNELVRSMRLDNARKLLQTSDLAIGKISAASGYASTEHFVRTFKKQYGVSPTAYRNRQDWKK